MTKFRWRPWAAVATGAVLAATLAACGSSGSGSGTTALPQDVNCVQQLTAAQTAQYVNQLAASGQQAQTQANSDGTTDVCVVEDVNGSYETHWYNRSDGSNFLTYLELMYLARSVGGYHSGNALLMYGVVDGSISPLEAFALSSLMDVNYAGDAYPLYYPSNGGYVYRSSLPSSYYHVTRCQYGHQRATTWTSTTLSTAHTGYTRPKVPAASDEEAQFSHGHVHVTTLSSNNKYGYHYRNPSLPTASRPTTRATPRSRVTVPTVPTRASTPRSKPICISTKYHKC